MIILIHWYIVITSCCQQKMYLLQTLSVFMFAAESYRNNLILQNCMWVCKECVTKLSPVSFSLVPALIKHAVYVQYQYKDMVCHSVYITITVTVWGLSGLITVYTMSKFFCRRHKFWSYKKPKLSFLNVSNCSFSPFATYTDLSADSGGKYVNRYGQIFLKH